MGEKKNYKYNLELSVDCVITFEEREALMSELYKLSDRMAEILGEKPISGVGFVFSKTE